MIQDFQPDRDLPSWLLVNWAFDTAAWQWLALLLLLFLAWIVGHALGAVICRTLTPLAARTATTADNEVLASITGPLRLIVACAVFRAGLHGIAPSRPVGRTIGYLLALVFYLALAWSVMRLIDVGSGRLVSAIPTAHRGPAQAFLPLGRRTLKAAAFAFAILATLTAWGYDTTALLAGLGVGGLAIALAAQKTIENFFGGLAITTDRPVVVGDFCKYDDKMGTVEDIGLRSTRIRTLDRTVVTVPNGAFSGMQIENFARRDKIWFHPILKLQLDTTTQQLTEVVQSARELLKSHSMIEQPAKVRLIGIGDYSLNVEVSSYVLTADFDAFLAIQEELLTQLLGAIEAAGARLAVPTQRNIIAATPVP